MKTLLFGFGIILIIQNCIGSFPSDIEKCKVGDVSCIAIVITELLKNNPNGKNDIYLPKLEPLRVTSLTVSQSGNGSPVNLNLSFKNVDVFGLSQIKVDRVVGFTEDPSTSKFEFYVTIPKLRFKGTYKASGRILILPVVGEGPCDIALENIKASIKFKPTIMNKNGKTYLGVDKIKSLLEPEKLTFHFDNLFNGDRTLGDNLNKFLNENNKDVWNELSSGINTGISEIIKSLILNILKNFAYGDIFKEN